MYYLATEIREAFKRLVLTIANIKIKLMKTLI